MAARTRGSLSAVPNSLDVSLSRRRRSFETAFDADSSALPVPPKPHSLLQHSPLLARFGPMA